MLEHGTTRPKRAALPRRLAGALAAAAAAGILCACGGGADAAAAAPDSAAAAAPSPDAPPPYAAHIRAAIREVTNRPITHLVYSHSHVDHIGGAGQLGGTPVIVAHEETARLLRRAGSNPWAVADHYIDRVAAKCVDALTPGWSARLAAFDVYVWDQCYAMEQSLRIE